MIPNGEKKTLFLPYGAANVGDGSHEEVSEKTRPTIKVVMPYMLNVNHLLLFLPETRTMHVAAANIYD